MENNKKCCSFCNKEEDKVQRLIAGPEGLYICDSCVEICHGLLEDMCKKSSGKDQKPLLKPEQMKEIIQACDRSKAGRTAPPQGLYLKSVEYDALSE